MKEPTKEQVKEFWKGIGFEWRDAKIIRRVLDSKGLTPVYSQSGWYLNNKLYHFAELPPVDLNNLFKHAVPKVSIDKIVFDGLDEWYCHLYIYDKSIKFIDFLGKPQKTHCITKSDIDPALALFWALAEARAALAGDKISVD